MIPLTRSVHQGSGRSCHPVIHVAGWAGRPSSGVMVPLAPLPYSMAGPVYKGMDPSDPATYVRPWAPAQGMISYLNADGAQLQGRTPTGLQSGPQQRKPRRLI